MTSWTIQLNLQCGASLGERFLLVYNCNQCPIWLVVSTPLKNMKVSWAYYSQYMETYKNVPNHLSAIYDGTAAFKWIHDDL